MSDSSIQFDPEIPWPLLLLGGGALLVIALRMAWIATGSLDRRRRSLLLILRGLALLGVIALLANPGRWTTESDDSTRGWALLLDRSDSMTEADGRGGGSGEDDSRWVVGSDFARRLWEASAQPDRVRSHLFAEGLGTRWEPGTDPASFSENGSRLDLAALSLLETATSEASHWNGVVVIGDGRQTLANPDLGPLISRARSLGIPIHTVPVGGPIESRDIAVTLQRRQLVSLPNQRVRIPLKVTNRGVDDTVVTLRLLDASGNPVPGIEPGEFEVRRDSEVENAFFLPEETAASGDYFVALDPVPGDEITDNNEDRFHLRILDKRTRIFLAEGAPYWDTKFLAQLLRGQDLMEVDAVYRVRPGHYYRIGTGDEPAAEESAPTFPEDELNSYDLVVLGKGVEAFLTPERADRIARFVRDRGGALLFSRGKPYAGNESILQTLELGNWGEETGSDYRLQPTPDGAETGLFGERLPGPGSDLWQQLDPLEDVRTLAELKPFTRVLAVGESVSGGSRVPLLLARRHGRGMVAAINGDGLWRWGFHSPSDRAQRFVDWHQNFWMETLLWTATYSEFLPGEDFSLRISPTSLAPGESARVRIGYRGALDPENAPPAPTIEITGPSPGSVQAAPAGMDEDGSPRWGAVFTPESSGAYTATLRIGDQRGPSVPFTVLPPTTEKTERSADRDLLDELSEKTGGQSWELDQVEALLAALEPDLPPVELQEAVWSPLWNRPLILAIIALLLGFEWASRRRFGLL